MLFGLGAGITLTTLGCLILLLNLTRLFYAFLRLLIGLWLWRGGLLLNLLRLSRVLWVIWLGRLDNRLLNFRDALTVVPFGLWNSLLVSLVLWNYRFRLWIWFCIVCLGIVLGRIRLIIRCSLVILYDHDFLRLSILDEGFVQPNSRSSLVFGGVALKGVASELDGALQAVDLETETVDSASLGKQGGQAERSHRPRLDGDRPVERKDG